MKIHNVRLGLATNSSSTHSLVLLSSGVGDDDVYDGEFGWDYWTAGELATKQRYLGIVLLQNLRTAGLNEDVAEAVAREWSGATSLEGYVDHQSVWDLPKAWTGSGLDKKFVDDLRGYLSKDNVAILGGNDNDDATHPLLDGDGFQLPLDQDVCSVASVARFDEAHKYWSIFNRVSGAKIRMSFDSPGKSVDVTKSTYPELVDVKITNFCPYGCAFCYQDSTKAGAHAPIDSLQNLARIFGEWRVFEVAIGGGEPTLHPNFVQILSMFRREGVVPNFTTRNVAWLRDDTLRESILGVAGAFAFSVDSADQVNQLAAALSYHKVSKNRATIQYIVGQDEGYGLYSIAEAALNAGIRLVLLGYKTNGRGSSLKTFKPDWIQSLKEIAKSKNHKYARVGIDTALAKEHEKELQKLGVDKILYTTQEGKFSMYIDAVEDFVAPSSYCEDGLKKAVKLGYNSGPEIAMAYSAW